MWGFTRKGHRRREERRGREGERRAPMGGGPGAKGMDPWGSRWLVSEDKINSADGVHSAAQEARRIEKGQM